MRLVALRGLSLRARLLIAIPAIALVVASFAIAIQFLHPVPPRRIVFAAGPEDGTLHAFAARYRDILKRDGIRVDVRTTQGTGENLQRLLDPESDVVAAFVLAGTAPPSTTGLVNVGNVFYAPLWVLGRREQSITTLAALRGKRIEVGLPASGLAVALEPVLAANGIGPDNTTILHLPEGEAWPKFAAGEIDVVFSGEGPHSRGFVEAVALPGVEIMDFARADAYARRFPHITRLELPAGTLDFVRNIPARDTTLIGATVMIAAREDLHPTVIDLLVDAAREVHGTQGYFERRGEFPNLVRVDAIPLSQQAVQYARTGPSFLRRYLPLWLADFLQRAFTLAIPVVAVVLPLVRWVPSLVAEMIGRRIRRCYTELRRLEFELDEAPRRRSPDAVLADLDRLAESVARVELPATYAGEIFGLRRNIALVRDAVAARAKAA